MLLQKSFSRCCNITENNIEKENLYRNMRKSYTEQNGTCFSLTNSLNDYYSSSLIHPFKKELHGGVKKQPFPPPSRPGHIFTLCIWIQVPGRFSQSTRCALQPIISCLMTSPYRRSMHYFLCLRHMYTMN